MKKILHISKYYFPFKGGIEQVAHDWVSALSDIYEQKVICFNHEKNEKIDFIDGIEIIRCGCFTKIFSQSLSMSYGRILKNVFDRYKPDIVIFHYPNPFVAFLLLICIPRCTKLVVLWHLDIVKQKILGKIFHMQNKRLIKRATYLIATSSNYVEGSTYLNAVYDKCKIVPNCVNEERLRLTDKSIQIAENIRQHNRNKIICFAIGRHTEYKGFSYLLRASKELDDRFEFFIAGEGELTEELKKEAGNDSKIHFLGGITDEELKGYLTAMDIFCFPSITKNEAFGLALAEAMYYGKPAVTFSIPGSGVNYVCINDQNGIEVPNRDIKAYAQALEKLAANPKLREQYGKNSKKRVLDNFLYEQFKRNVRAIVNNL